MIGISILIDVIQEPYLIYFVFIIYNDIFLFLSPFGSLRIDVHRKIGAYIMFIVKKKIHDLTLIEGSLKVKPF